MSTMSDPVLYPAPAGTSEALRQDVARSRQELAETVEALAARLDLRAAVRRKISASAADPVVSAAVAGTAVYALSHLSRLRRLPRVLLGAAASAIVYLTIDRIPLDHRTNSNRGSVADGKPAADGEASAERVALSPSPDGGDVVDVLLAQHQDVQRIFDRVAAADDAPERRELFAILVETLHRHEMAEQEIVHPALRGPGDSSASVADAEFRKRPSPTGRSPR